jgi:hypothetical protein
MGATCNRVALQISAVLQSHTPFLFLLKFGSLAWQEVSHSGADLLDEARSQGDAIYIGPATIRFNPLVAHMGPFLQINLTLQSFIAPFSNSPFFILRQGSE